MPDDGLLRILSWPATPLWVVALIVSVGAFKVWPLIMERVNERLRDREAAKASDWTRLRGEIDRIDGRCQRLEEREEECQRNLADARTRLADLEGYMMGQGEAKQAAQRALSADRMDDAKAKSKDPK